MAPLPCPGCSALPSSACVAPVSQTGLVWRGKRQASSQATTAGSYREVRVTAESCSVTSPGLPLPTLRLEALLVLFQAVVHRNWGLDCLVNGGSELGSDYKYLFWLQEICCGGPLEAVRPSISRSLERSLPPPWKDSGTFTFQGPWTISVLIRKHCLDLPRCSLLPPPFLHWSPQQVGLWTLDLRAGTKTLIGPKDEAFVDVLTSWFIPPCASY